jgi:GNAT superfamily N-acetyltransferase
VRFVGRAADDAVEVRPVALEDVLPIRQRILRPYQRVQDVEFEGDRRPGALHVGAFVADRLVGAASILPHAHPVLADPNTWRIRGMAVDDDVRDRGIGGALLDRCLDHARSRGAALVWCNARIGAVRFYERHAFLSEGDPFDVDLIGRHVRMRRTL